MVVLAGIGEGSFVSGVSAFVRERGLLVLRRQSRDKARLPPHARSLLRMARSLSTALLSCDLGREALVRTVATHYLDLPATCDSNNPLFFKKYCTLGILL